MRVLVVDDSASTLAIITHFIEKNDDFEVIAYNDPLKVVEDLNRLVFDIAVIDFVMPGIDGLSLIDKIKSRPEFSSVPVLVLTANSDRQTRIEALSAGAIDFMTKPVEPLEFNTRLKNIGDLRSAQLMLEDKARLLNFEVEHQTRMLVEREQDIVNILTKTAGFRDDETGNHSLRVGKFSGVLAHQLGLPNEVCKDINVAAQMHDIGKVAISDEILKNKEKFSEGEYTEMKRHTEVGGDILSGSTSPLLKMASVIAKHHHEKWNGGGYPSGLAGADIPLEARIVSLADCFDALTSARRYKEAWCVEKVCQIINSESGISFDPVIVGAFNDALPEFLRIKAAYLDSDEKPAEIAA